MQLLILDVYMARYSSTQNLCIILYGSPHSTLEACPPHTIPNHCQFSFLISTKQCCECYGPVGGTVNYCDTKCNPLNGGTIINPKKIYTCMGLGEIKSSKKNLEQMIGISKPR